MPESERIAISTADAAKRLGVSDETIKRYIFGKQLEGFKLPGGHYRIWLDSIDKMTSS